MARVKKSVTLPEELYKEAVREGKNFSGVVSEALKEYLRKRKREKLKSLWGSMKDLWISEGTEFVNELRNEELKAQRERERWQGI